MAYHVSILDKSPIPEGATATDALRRTVALAQRAEQLGYRRYWLAEHHASPTLACSAPEIVVSHILARTTRIRVGSGGVMLQHYSPYKVAETFKVLACLAPGRVDLGVGKAPGGLPQSSRALQSRHDASRTVPFEDLLVELDGFLDGGLAPDHPRSGTVAAPQPSQFPQRFLLGGSHDSALLAARLGWDFVYAGHFNGDAHNIERCVDAYRSETGGPPLLAVYAVAAATADRAARLVAGLRSFKVHLAGLPSVNLPSLEAAAEFARQAGVSDYRTEEQYPHVIAGTGEDVRSELDRLSQRYGIREFVVDNPVAEFGARLASIELLAGPLGPTRAATPDAEHVH